MKFFTKIISSFIIFASLSFSLGFTANAQSLSSTILTVGSSGQNVALLQQKLKALGYYNYEKITSYYSIITQDAVIRFQKANNLAVDGIAGDKTISKIDQLLNNGNVSYYTVKPGDSFWTISLKYGTTVDRLKAVNNTTSDMLIAGQTLKIVTPISYSSTDLYWLSRIIEAEAGGEPYLGKVAVGNVIINRVASADFPNNIKDVIFQYCNGIPQFSPVAEGTIYNSPSADSVKAAQDALNGSKPVGQALFFFNPDKASAPWIVNNRTYVTRIGNHVFYK